MFVKLIAWSWETPAVAVAAENIILTDDRVEQVTRSDALRVFVVIPGIGSGNRDQAGGELRWPGKELAARSSELRERRCR